MHICIFFCTFAPKIVVCVCIGVYIRASIKVITKRKENTMLGMRESNSPITGQAARDIRMQMWRIASGHQNEFDHQMAGSLNKANTEKRYSVEWRD